MQESVIYQDILQRGVQQGRQQGKREEAISLLIRQLRRRFGTIDLSLQGQIGVLSLEQLEELGEALLDFKTLADLTIWLNRHRLESILIHQLRHRFGTIDPLLEEQVRMLPLIQLEELGKVLLDFETVTDLAMWLNEHQLEDGSDRL